MTLEKDGPAGLTPNSTAVGTMRSLSQLHMETSVGLTDLETHF